MEYKVEIRLIEIYNVYVEAVDEDDAEAIALRKFNEGGLSADVDTMEITVE